MSASISNTLYAQTLTYQSNSHTQVEFQSVAAQESTEASEKGVSVSLSDAAYEAAEATNAQEINASANENKDMLQELMDQLQEIQLRISELLTQIQNIMSDADLTAEQKLEMTGPLQEEVAALSAEQMQIMAQIMELLKE